MYHFWSEKKVHYVLSQLLKFETLRSTELFKKNESYTYKYA